ncbi:MAG: Gfo/Idh/MocA family oxidoreductase [Verrucomicrobiia bacterium]
MARKDIDAICISTPDHWHVPISLMAIRAGKDVICEKPTLTIEEGQVLTNTVKRHGVIFQTSTEDRSLPVYHRMAELVRNGRIGKLHTIHVGLPSGGGRNIPIERQQPEPVPPTLDYEMWLGPAPWAPYCAARCHWNFRWVYDYSGGILTDWGMHLVDTAQWGNNTERSGPVTVEGKGEFPTSGIYNTATECHLEYTYANGVKMFIETGGVALRFEGTDGWVANKGWIGPLEAGSPRILTSIIGPDETHLYTCLGGEHRNFLDCVKSRRDPYFPAEIGHRCASVMHIGNAAMLLGRKLRWNPEKEEFVNNESANRMRSRAMRAPWTL